MYTLNMELFDKHRIVPYCESTSFIKFDFSQHKHSVIAGFKTMAESLIASSDRF